MAGSSGGLIVDPVAYQKSLQLQQPLPSMQALDSATAPAPTGPGLTSYTDMQGLGHPYAASPSVATNIYSTGPQVIPGTGSTPQQNKDLATYTSGQGSISQGAFENQQQAQLNAQLQAEAEARRLGYLSTITGQQSPAVGPQGGPAFDENAARAVAFARAKEQAGQTALASLKALNDVMASSGLTGSSVEQQGVSNIIGGAGGAVNNFSRTQLIQDLSRAADIADRNQQNAITQRGQNLSLIPSLMGLITATRGAY